MRIKKPRWLNCFLESSIGKGVCGAIFLAVLWEIVPRLFDVSPSVFPPLHSVLRSMYDNGSLILQELGFTFMETLIAWMLSLLLAGALACSMDLSRNIETFALYPLLAFQHVPKVAITPLLVIWVGHGWLPVIVLGVLIAFFPMFEGYRDGFNTDRTGIRKVFGPLCQSRIKKLILIKLPEAVPMIIHGAKLGMTFSIVGVLVGELAIKDHGLGKLIDQGNELFQYDLQFAAVLAACLLGLALYGLVVMAENSSLLSRYKYDVSSIVSKRDE